MSDDRKTKGKNRLLKDMRFGQMWLKVSQIRPPGLTFKGIQIISPLCDSYLKQSILVVIRIVLLNRLLCILALMLLWATRHACHFWLFKLKLKWLRLNYNRIHRRVSKILSNYFSCLLTNQSSWNVGRADQSEGSWSLMTSTLTWCFLTPSRPLNRKRVLNER